jgi:alpha-ketoglutarate-dependent dioxygenase alkB family protein 2
LARKEWDWMSLMLKLKAVSDSESDPTNPNPTVKTQTVDLGNGSEIVYIQRFIPFDQAWKWFHYLNNQIPWTRPTIRVFGRSCVQVLPFLF